MPLKIIFFLFFLTTWMISTPCTAQWGYYNSNRNAYVPFRGDRTGLFFPKKDPEEQKLSLGQVVFRPGLAVSETWTSNLTLAPADAQEDFFTQIFPALAVELPYKRSTFEAEYVGSFDCYSRNARYNADEHLFTARGRVNVLQDSWLFIDSTTALLYTDVEELRPYIPELSLRRRFNYYANSLTFDPAPFKKFAVRVQYGNVMSRYVEDRDKEGDYTRDNPGVLLGYLIRPRTRLLAGYNFVAYSARQQDPRSDYHEHSAVFGIEWSVADRFRADAQGSYNWDEFTDIAGSIQIWGARVSARYEPLKRLALDARYERSSQPTLSFTGDRYDPLTEAFSIYYIQDVATLSCEYHFRHDLIVWLNLTYKRLDFPEEGRSGVDRLDNIYGGTAQLIYKFRPWLRFSALGGYSRGDSTESFERYENILSQLYVQCAF